MTGEGHQGKFKNSKGASAVTYLTSYIFLKLKDERQVWRAPPLGTVLMFSLVKTLLTDKTH